MSAKTRDLSPDLKRVFSQMPLCIIGFLHPLHSFADAPDRWGERRKRGLTDAELREAILDELGIQGCAWLGDWRVNYGGESLMMSERYVTRAPYIVVLKLPGKKKSEKPLVLQGHDLVCYVRDLLQIPEPKERFPLFEEILE